MAVPAPAEGPMEQERPLPMDDSARDWVSVLLSEPALDLEAHLQVHPLLSPISLPPYDPFFAHDADFDLSHMVQDSEAAFFINPSPSDPPNPRIRVFDCFATANSALPCRNFPNSHSPAESNLTQGSNQPYFSLEEHDLSAKEDNNLACASNGGSMLGNASSGQQLDSRELGTQFQGSEDSIRLTSEELREGEGQSQLQFGSESRSKITESSTSRKTLGRKSRSSSPEETMGDSSKTQKNGGGDAVVDEEDEQKKLARLMRNRESAHLSRQRKKAYVDELEERIKTMASTITELNNTISLISAENINLRRQLGFYNQPPVGSCGKPVGVPMAVPWVPYPNLSVGGIYMGAGSQVPVLPIPRLKSQTIPARREKKSKLEGQQDGREKAPKKTKKMAGFAFMGIFFVITLLFPFKYSLLGLKAIVGHERRVLPSGWDSHSEQIAVRGGGRVLASWDEDGRVAPASEESQARWVGISGDKPTSETVSHGEKCVREGKPDGVQSTMSAANSESAHETMSQLSATLFVPRNGTLVKIDGNLIIHSLLAAERAGKEPTTPQTRNKEFKRNGLDETAAGGKGLALASNIRKEDIKIGKEELLRMQGSGVHMELQRALTESGAFHSEKIDVSSQEWFVEGIAGPVFSSGMCKEVFQFETSATSSSTSRASSDLMNDEFTSVKEAKKEYVSYDKDEYHGQAQSGAGHQVQFRRERNPYAVPLPPVKEQAPLDDRSRKNETAKHTAHSIREGKVSLAVSVLAGPSEFGDEAGLQGGSTGLSKFFVVILIDSVKYVTYSCMLPSKGTQSQL